MRGRKAEKGKMNGTNLTKSCYIFIYKDTKGNFTLMHIEKKDA